MKEFLLILLLGALGIWKSVPVGFILKMDPLSVAAATISGASAAVVTLYMTGSRVKGWVMKKMNTSGLQRKKQKMSRIFDRYGPMGVGFIGSLVLGPNLALVIGLTMVRTEKQLLFAVLAGIVVWTSLLTFIAYLGTDLFMQIGI